MFFLFFKLGLYGFQWTVLGYIRIRRVNKMRH